MAAMEAEVEARIQRELHILRAGGQQVDLITSDWNCVIYRAVPTKFDVGVVDVAVPIPSGYPGSLIDLAAIPDSAPFLAKLPGGINPQGTHIAEGKSWTLASYHPYQWSDNQWDQTKHGFHTYYDQILSWLNSSP
ncbi:MAG TPA: E2/UBC family protein [Fimbriimonadaceae bacterium]|nr:E2/UBC family protein [Fimbriimonadaceae bacterium]